MKLSTRARYGLRAMIELARHEDGITGRCIAENQQLPAAYLEQLMARLRNANLVISIRGAKGKFMLARQADTITLAEIVEALDGPIEIANCSDVLHCRGNRDLCVLRDVCHGANKALHDYLSNLTLDMVVKRQEQHDGRVSSDFCI